MINKPTFKTALLAALMLVVSDAYACLTSEQESNNTQSQANQGMCSGTTLSGNLNRRDTDWFAITTSDAGTVDISLDHHSRDDFDWSLQTANGTELGYGSTSQVPETGQVSVPGADTYYIKLTRYRGQGWYDLTVDYPEASTPPGDSCQTGSRPSKPGSLQSWLTGSGEDACPSLSSGQGAVLLMGGGSDVDDAFSNRVRNHIGDSADVVVLRTSGSDGYNDYLSGLMNADSVETLMLDNRTKADSDYADWVIRNAEFVFVAGGDQSDYLNQWAGTKTQSAIQSVYDRGGVIGGTSAGMALMADSIYDPDGIAGAVSDEVVTDFCHSTLNFSDTFVDIPVLRNSLTDTHFYERDRMGRALVSLAHHSNQHFAIAASEGTSIFIESNGLGVVDGSYEVYVLRESSQTSRTQLSCGSPVIYEDVLRVKLLSGDTYNFATQSYNGEALSISVDGRNTNFYSPTSPY